MERFVAGAVQMDVRLGRVRENAARAVAGVRRLAAKGARLVLLPEMFAPGFDNLRLAEHARATPEVLDRLAGVCRQEGVVAVGTLPEAADGGIYNTAYVVEADGRCVAAYRKIHLFMPTGEHEHFLAGRTPVVARTSVGRLGLATCFDLRFPEFCRALAERGADVLAVCAQWPAVRVSHWDLLCAARAVENQLWVVASNRSGEDPGLVYGGHSRVVSPWGRVVARGGRRPALVSGQVDPEETRAYRQAIPCEPQKVFRIHVPEEDSER